MTKQEAFKKRIRERMAHTGEKYGAARRVLIDRASPDTATERVWAAQPEHPEESVRDATGHGWNEWCDLIEAWPGHTEGHAAIAAWIVAEHDTNHWWAQGVTVGFERITGQRAINQMSDGTYTANKSKTVTIDAVMLRELLLDAAGRADLFPDVEVELRSKPTTKVLRMRIGGGVALFDISALGDGRARIVVAHEKLSAADDVPQWKAYWAEWLAALDGL